MPRPWPCVVATLWRLLTRQRLYALGVAVIVLAGCSKNMWVSPPGVTDQQFRREAYECERDASMLPATPSPAPLPPSYTGQVYPGGAYTVTPQPNPAQGFQDLSVSLGDRARREGLFTRCMESKGYRKASADERRAMESRAPGRVGMRVDPRDTRLVVVTVTPGGPADRAGLMVGDHLVKIDGVPVDARTPQVEIAVKITGTPGSKVILTILRENEQKDFAVTREVPSQ